MSRNRNGFFVRLITALMLAVSLIAPLATTPQVALAAPSISLEQCANLTDPTCDWQNGNLGQSNSLYYEGDSVAYRMLIGGLTIGETYTVTIQWDTTKGGKHALDYLTSYNETVTSADPCEGATCTGPASTYPIPDDPNIGIAQIPGVFTMWGGTITGVSAYAVTGSYAGDSSTSITITFEATATSAVLAWGGHIASRADWGQGNSAVNISGSPYHMRNTVACADRTRPTATRRTRIVRCRPMQ